MRYIGNKTKLLPEIEKLLKDKNILDENLIFCDGFSGTGSVGTYFGKYYKKIISNDTMYFSYIYTNGRMKFNSNFEKLGFDPFEYLNNYDTTNYINGFCYNNYSPKGNRMYFSDENAKKIDFIRDNIENWYSKNKINKQEKYYLIACLIESMSLRSNTYGIFAGYSKKWDERAKKELILNRIETNNYNSDIYNENIIDLMEYVNGDILYLDPPYTARDYSTNYHVLETIAKNDKPELKGITGQRKNNVNKNQDNYSFTKKNEAEIALENVIRKANFKYIILSYSQDGLISKEFIESLFKRYTKKDTYEFRKIKYTKYQDYKSEIKNNHFEYLFFIEKKENIYYDVPLSYQGNKFSIIEWLSEYFPKNIDTFYDLFGGGSTVATNANANKIIYNDEHKIVKELVQYLKETDIKKLIQNINNKIKKYDLKKHDKESYYKLRADYNQTKDLLLLYLLTLYSFNNLIKFNSKKEFNVPVGNRYFNDKIKEKLISFHNMLENKIIEYHSKDYETYLENIKKNDFVYFDPPYLITLASYNETGCGYAVWNEEEEKRLLNFIDKLNEKGIKFMLSNVLEHKDKKNNILKDWINKNNYKVYYKNDRRNEIIVVNY